MRFPKVNLHSHTTYCDGKESVESMIQAAIAKDFVRLGFSGHVFNDFRPEDQDIWDEQIITIYGFFLRNESLKRVHWDRVGEFY